MVIDLFGIGFRSNPMSFQLSWLGIGLNPLVVNDVGLVLAGIHLFSRVLSTCLLAFISFNCCGKASSRA